MFSLGTGPFPTDTDSLRSALAAAVRLSGAGEGAVATEGSFPSLDALRVNLTGACFDSRSPFARAVKPESGGFFARNADVSAEPASLASVPVRIRFHAEDCVFEFGTAADGARALSLRSCTGGSLDASASVADIEAALLKLAQDAAASRGAEVQSVKLTLVSEGPRQVSLSAAAVAKAMFMTAKLTMQGRVTLDDQFNLRLSGVTCTGDGMLANLAASQLRPMLSKIEARTFSILSFLPPGIGISSISIEGGDALRIHATLQPAK